MRKSLLLATTLGAALLVAAPALAQQRGGSAGAGYGFDPPPGTPVTPHGQGGAGLIPPVGQQYDAARRAEAAAAGREADSLLRQADAALARGNFGLANEYLERAETALLNRDAITGAPQRSDLHRRINEARQALMNRDREQARQQVRMALDMAGRDTSAMTGTATPTMPAQGGGAVMAPQAGPQGLGRGNWQTGANPTAVPPYGGPTGAQTMPSPHMPGTSGTQAAGVPAVPPTGRGAPPPGQPFPQAGGTSSQLSTGGQIIPGSPTAGQAADGGPGGGAAGGGAGGTR